MIDSGDVWASPDYSVTNQRTFSAERVNGGAAAFDSNMVD